MVLQSLATIFPSMCGDGGQLDYLISRVAEHGRRRAAQMCEVAATLEGAVAVTRNGNGAAPGLAG
jgi:hypothetical protein